MDLPAVPALESSAQIPQDADNSRLPELSRSQTTLGVTAGFCGYDQQPNPRKHIPACSAVTSTVNKRKSLRSRPSQILHLQDADPLPLMSDTTTLPVPQLRKRTSSKMSLFSLFSKSKVDKLQGCAELGLDIPEPPTRTQHADAESASLRPPTSKSYSAKGPMLAITDPSPVVPIDRTGRARAFEPPPLFQVWPQATKHASFEVSHLPPETASQKSKHRGLGTTLLVPNADAQSVHLSGERHSFESRMKLKPSPHDPDDGSVSPVNLPTKLMVLVTSGYLLQYAATGDAQRFPEKVLQLQKDSAAYACDLIPGKHHVLQVVQSVDDSGVIMNPASTFFSKLGLRSQATRRAASNMLLVMSGAEDMDEWMTAIREEIERQGGKRARSGSSSGRARECDSSMPALVPSLSHRYQVKRSASIANVSPAKLRTADADTAPPTTTDRKSQDTGAAKSVEQRQMTPIDQASSSRPRAISDTPSISSSIAVSEDQKQLDKLRDSARSSHASTTPTASASLTSRTNSITSSPPMELTKESPSLQQDDLTVANRLYRNLSSYSISKRRSAVLPSAPLICEPLSPETEAKRETVEKSRGFPALKQPLCSAQSMLKGKQAGKISSGRPPHPEDQVRPESFLADLPGPSTYTLSLQHSRSSPDISQSRTLHSIQTRPPKQDSHSFSLPLRINTSDSMLRQPSRSRVSHYTETDIGLRSPIPAATTLIAKVDPTAVAGTNQRSFAEHAAAAAAAMDQSRCTSAGRLSLFPPVSPVGPPQSTSPVEDISATSGQAFRQSSSLRRPASLQVRTDVALLLSAPRLSPVSPNTRARSSAALPRPSLKSSRSALAISGRVSPARAAGETFNFSTRRFIGEQADEVTPLPTRCESPYKLSHERKVRASASLPEMDYGISLVGLGPPAPPPTAPLPELPPAGRPSSRATSRAGSRQGTHPRSCTPIGVALGGSPTSAHGSPAPTMHSVGLGIEVGGY